MDTKSPFASKTLWVALFMAVLGFFPIASTWISANPSLFASCVAGLFAGLRILSKGKISIE